MPHDSDDEQLDGEHIDFVALLAKNDPDPLEPPILDKDEILPSNWRMGSTPGSRTYAARETARRASIAILERQDSMNASDVRVMTEIIRWTVLNGSDIMTMSVREIAAMCGMPRASADDSLRRLVRDGWLTVVEVGKPGRPVKGRVGKATRYGVVGTPPPTTSRKTVGGSPLRVRPKAGRPDIKESEIPIEPVVTKGSLVSGISREVTLSKESGGDTLDTEMSESDETLEKEMSGVGDTLERLSATEWLEGRLAWGPEVVATVLRDAFGAGYSRSTIYRAADRLGVVSVVEMSDAGGRGKPPTRVTHWQLPDLA